MTRFRLLVRAVVAVVVTAMPLAAAGGDVVELNSGQRVEGLVRELDLDTVVIERDGGIVTLSRDEVRAIYLETGRSALTPGSPARDALRALRHLQASTLSLDLFEQYVPRLLDAKALVGRYLAEAEPGHTPLRQAIRTALHYYVLAGIALNPRSTADELSAVGRDPVLPTCRQFEEVFQATQALGPRMLQTSDGATARGLAVAMVGLGAVWECAADQIRVAEQLLGTP